MKTINTFTCTCGNTDPVNTKDWTNNFTGHRYIICTCCGRYQDDKGKIYEADAFSLKALGGIKEQKPPISDMLNY